MLPLRQRWCLAIGAPIVAGFGLDPTALGGWAPDHIARARGEHEIAMVPQDALRRAYGITARNALIAWVLPRRACARRAGGAILIPHVRVVTRTTDRRPSAGCAGGAR